MVMLKFGGVAGVSYLCHGSVCSEVPRARTHSTSEHLRYMLPFFFLFSVTRSLFFSSYPFTLFIRAFLCVAAPSSLLAESWKEIGKERARGRVSKRAREGCGPCYGSDRVSALSEAFHHIFAAMCTPASQNPHSKLLQLLLKGILIVLHAAWCWW